MAFSSTPPGLPGFHAAIIHAEFAMNLWDASTRTNTGDICAAPWKFNPPLPPPLFVI